MHRIVATAAVALALALVAGPVAAMTVEEVIAKHVEARGGDRWGSIDSLKISGSYTAFSETHPFTLLRKRDRYHLDHTMAGSRVIVGWDGTNAWSDGGDGPEPIQEPDRSILLSQIDFVTPLFDHAEQGHRVTLLGPTEFEGMKTVAIELERRGGGVETWHLDPDTYLEVARISPGNDWLGPVERITFYEDFRNVDGVKIPFYVESQWYTRNRVMEVERVETNAPIDEAVFRMPLPPGMDVLAPLAGSFDVSIATRQQPGADWQESERQSTIESLMGGGLLQERFEMSGGVEVLRQYSFDKFHERYRITQIDNRRNQLNVQEGERTDEGKIVVSNVDTGTSWSGFGMTFHGRMSILDITEDGFRVEYETSVDGGESWFVNGKATYRRRTDG